MKLQILMAATALVAGAAQAQTTSSSAPTVAPTPGPGMSSTPGSPNSTPGTTAPTQQAYPSSNNTTTAPGSDNVQTPMNGTTTSSAMTEKMARDRLAGAGYGSVRSLKRNDRGDWEAVMLNGKTEQRVTVGSDGKVAPIAPM